MVRGFSSVTALGVQRKILPQPRFVGVLRGAVRQDTKQELVPTEDNRTGEKEDISIRSAEPDEINELSILIADGFASQQGMVRRWVSRWIIYLGLIERLVKTSFIKGWEESQTSKSGHSNANSVLGGIQEIFVAEAKRIDGTLQIVGVVELTSAQCPIPLGSKSRPAPFVCNFAVLPEYRGLGLGRALLQRCEKAADRDYGQSEIWLETRCTNAPALRLYQSEEYACEGLDPDIREEKRKAFLRKRLREGSPEIERDVLRIERRVSKDGEDIWEALYDIGDGRCIVELTFLEKNFGTLAPL
jgi:ribosomal protein S18 acetylase RimI-like enzyme